MRTWRWAFALLSWTIVPVVVYVVLALALPRAGVDTGRRTLIKPLSTGRDSRPATSVALGAIGLVILLVVAGYFPLARWALPIALVLADADIAAHLDDSVLQTLALIRSRAGDADAGRLLARQQEAELRDYLYRTAATRPRWPPS